MLWANFMHIYQPPDQKKFIMDSVVQDAYRAIIAILRENSHARITMSIIGSLLVKLDREGYQDVIDGFREIVNRGQIELTSGAMFHPFLPKLPDSEIYRQISLNNDIHQFYFGSAYKPVGFYSPEAGYSFRVAEIAKSMGYEWTIVDEIAFSGKLSQREYDYQYTPGFYSGGADLRKIVGEVSATQDPVLVKKRPGLSDRRKFIQTVDYSKLYTIRGLDGFLVHFRERVISDAMASGQIKTPEQLLQVLQPEMGKDRYLLTGMDGEAYGHHQKELDHVLGQMYHRRALEAITISELPEHFPVEKEVDPIPSTWGTSETEIEEENFYARWHHIDNKIHDKQWELTELAIRAVNGVEDTFKGETLKDTFEGFSQDSQDQGMNETFKGEPFKGNKGNGTRELLDEALYSCHYWWASARPWWSIELIERGARALADVVAMSEGFEGGIREVEEKGVIVGQSAEALRLYQDIVFTAFDWLRSEKVWDLSHRHK